jgi:WD40 repeat protein
MQLGGHRDFSFAAAWHPSGHLLATGNQDSTTRVWDLRSPGEPVAVLGGTMRHPLLATGNQDSNTSHEGGTCSDQLAASLWQPWAGPWVPVGSCGVPDRLYDGWALWFCTACHSMVMVTQEGFVQAEQLQVVIRPSE